MSDSINDEIADIMAMSDDEIMALARDEGIDDEQIAAMRQQFDVIARLARQRDIARHHLGESWVRNARVSREYAALVEEVRHLRTKAALADALGLISIADVAEALGIDPPDTTHELLMRLRAQAAEPRPGLISIDLVAQAMRFDRPPRDALELLGWLRAYYAELVRLRAVERSYNALVERVREMGLVLNAYYGNEDLAGAVCDAASVVVDEASAPFAVVEEARR